MLVMSKSRDRPCFCITQAHKTIRTGDKQPAIRCVPGFHNTTLENREEHTINAGIVWSITSSCLSLQATGIWLAAGAVAKFLELTNGASTLPMLVGSSSASKICGQHDCCCQAASVICLSCPNPGTNPASASHKLTKPFVRATSNQQSVVFLDFTIRLLRIAKNTRSTLGSCGR